MWEFNPEGPRTVKHFFSLKLEEMCKLFFGQRVECPDTTEYAGLSCNRLDAQVTLKPGTSFILIIIVILKIPPWPGMAQQGGENQVSGATS